MALVADANGAVSGKFTIPAGIPAGDKLVEFTGGSGSRAIATFSGQGQQLRQTLQQQTTILETRWQSPPPPPPPVEPQFRTDPLAQTFTLPITRQISGCDLFFTAKSTTTTRIQIRNTELGLPNQDILIEAIIQPAQINLGGAATRISFPYPVTLLAGTEYAMMVLCDDADGELSVAALGAFDTISQTWVTSQPYTVGVLLSSSNQSTWTPHQDRDLTFRLLAANYQSNTRTIALGNVPVTNATDLLLMAYAERPSSATDVRYILTLPNGTSVTVADGQPVQLSAPVTGTVGVQAVLTGTALLSPVLFPGIQLVAGTLQPEGTYYSVAIPAGQNVRVKVIYEAIIPQGASVVVKYQGSDVGDILIPVPLIESNVSEDGFFEYIHEITGVNEASVHVQLTLNGTAAARPRVRDLRAIVQ